MKTRMFRHQNQEYQVPASWTDEAALNWVLLQQAYQRDGEAGWDREWDRLFSMRSNAREEKSAPAGPEK